MTHRVCLLLIVFITICCIVSAQKRFSVTLEVPAQLDKKWLEVYVDDGKGELEVNKVFKGNKLTVSKVFYSKYASLALYYPKGNHTLYDNRFFFKDRPATITLVPTDSANSPLDNYRLVNAVDFKKEKQLKAQFCSVDTKKVEAFFDANAEVIYNSSDSAINAEYSALYKKLIEKELDYIEQNGNSYYSFFTFRKGMVFSEIRTPDTLLQIFNSTFPDSFRLNAEGMLVTKYLKGRLTAKKNNYAPNFISRNVGGNSINLADYRGQKLVLLTFWATWCGPCVEEIPVIKTIREKYPLKDLEIISIGYQSTYAAFKKTINEKQMDWVHIYNDVELINSYGGYKAIPRTYLLDKTGKIIYEASVDEKESSALPNLEKLLAQCLL